MSLLEQLVKQRKSVRSYDAEFRMKKDEILDLLSLASNAPSSSNLQPWRFIVIQNKELQKELRTIGFNQAQIEDSSAIVAVLGDIEAYKNVEKIYSLNVEKGYMDQSIADRTIKQTLNMYPTMPKETLMQIAAYDAGAVAMQFMLLAKDRGYDTITMGGFDKDAFAKRFNLPDHLFPITLIAVGKAAAPAFNTTRLPIESLTTYYE